MIETGLVLLSSNRKSQCTQDFPASVFNRPGVAGAVLQTPLYLID